MVIVMVLFLGFGFSHDQCRLDYPATFLCFVDMLEFHAYSFIYYMHGIKDSL